MSAEPQCPECREREEVIRQMRVSFEARIAELESRRAGTNLEQETPAALSEPYQEMQQNVRAAGVKNTDETDWRQAGQRRWLWLAAAQTAACFKVCVGRGKAALGELLGEAIQGITPNGRFAVP